METVVNHFVHRTAAERYERHRPYFHPGVIARIRDRLALTAPLPRALDVGCGPGQSAAALRAIAAEVVATDISPAMLAAAPPIDGVRFLCAPAESLPFPAASFPLLTVGLAVHWFDQPRFLAEAARVLAPGGWLVLYGYHHSRQIVGQPDYPAWFEQVFLRRYPPTARHGAPTAAAELAPHGLEWHGRTEFEESRTYSAADFALSLLTHSNVIQRVEGGHESLASAHAWLLGELTPFFGGQLRDCGFAGWISWARKPSR